MSENNSIPQERLKTLIEINSRINLNMGDAEALLVSILESAMCLVECEAASLLLVHKEDGTLHFAYALGPKGAEAKKIPVNLNSIAGWVFEHNQSVIINDANKDDRFNPEIQSKTKYITHNMIAFPMSVEGECIGVIELINKAENKEFTNSDLYMLELLGGQAAIAYKNAKNYRFTQERANSLQETVQNGKEYHTFIANSPVILDMMSVISQVAQTSSSVLIIGESGVGKELFAEQIHLKSKRNGKPFVRVSCAALSPSLLESELFGHEKGAYTDAFKEQKGRFEMADGGTLFLDEIGELPLNLQAKLLRAIQERKFERVGSSETISVDVRIIAATNRDLEAMVKEGTFRGDLYYRLNVMPLNIPPLRQRKEDIEPLAAFFLNKFAGETKKNITGFSNSAMNALFNYYWPGNIRELENTIERACILCSTGQIQARDLSLPDIDTYSDQKSTFVEDTVAESVEGEDKSLKTALTNFKKEYVTRILKSCNWNQTEAAKILDVQRTYVSKLINELNISVDK